MENNIEQLILHLQELISHLDGYLGSSVWDSLLSFGVPVLIASIGAIVSIIQLRFNKISSARIEWVQSLRELISILLQSLSQFSNLTDEIRRDFKKNNITGEDRVDHLMDHYGERVDILEKEIKLLISKVMLMLNPDDSKHMKVEKNLKDYEKIVSEGVLKYIHLKTIKEHEENIINSSRIVLKEAWDQSKNIWQ